MVQSGAKRMQLESHLNKKKEGLLFLCSSHLFWLRASWNFLISLKLFALPNIKIFYFRARVHHFWWLLIFDSFLTLDSGKLKQIQTSQKSFCKILLSVLRASKRPDISAPLHNSSVHFHLHNCSLKILDDHGLNPKRLFISSNTDQEAEYDYYYSEEEDEEESDEEDDRRRLRRRRRGEYNLHNRQFMSQTRGTGYYTQGQEKMICWRGRRRRRKGPLCRIRSKNVLNQIINI